jgi:cyclic beta-1,2-glucan synthetase
MPQHDWNDDPTTGELWDIDRLERHAHQLALRSGPTPTAARRSVGAHLDRNVRLLREANLVITAALRDGRAITPAAEWLLDNFHIIADQASSIRLNLSTEVWRELPPDIHPDNAGWPRIYCLALDFLAHSDCDFNGDHLARYLTSYQHAAPLTMRELWAVSPVLRLSLLDQLRRFAVRIATALDARGAADAVVDALMTERPALAPGRQLPPLILPAVPHRDAFVVQLSERLGLLGEDGKPMLLQLSGELRSSQTTIDDVIQREHARRSSSNHSVRKIFTSLRSAETFDWRRFFDRVSPVEALLRTCESYRACDSRTRDRYRHCIEEIARGDARSELMIADITLRQLAVPPPVDCSGRIDIGDLLIGSRRAELEAAVDFRPSTKQRVKRYLVRNASILYPIGVIATALAMAFSATNLGFVGADWQTPQPWLMAMLTILPASAVAVGLINRIWMRQFPPRYLPRLSLESGLNAELGTLVVMPVLLREIRDVERYVQALHVHSIANKDAQLRFALLSDGVDAETATVDGDAELLDAATAAIEALNAADPSPPAQEPRYYLFHRRRQWNPHERCFMGWERKRGKLMELNRLLLGSGPTSFTTNSGDTPTPPSRIRYVLTLDADTRTPLGVVRDLVGVAAHPLNRPVFDPPSGCNVSGYGVLQPRITALLPTYEERSLYREIVTGGSGIDPYEAAASDLYQDVFGEGLFTGKGLYDVHAFEGAMAGRVPENTLLSHDLLEGLFVRCALVNDISLFEEFPSHSEVAASRTHRWTRGDWQLLPWICGRRGPLPALGRWKMLDNLRRSLLPPVSVAVLVASWSIDATIPLVWYAVVLMPWLWPALVNVLARIAFRPEGRSRRNHARQLATEFIEDLGRAVVSLALLAQNAWISLDAIGRAMTRQLLTHRYRLEWVTAAQVKELSSGSLTGFIWPMKGASVVVLTASACVMWFNTPALMHAAPMLLVWWLSPLLARFLSRPLDRPAATEVLSRSSVHELRDVARRTWRFFETFVTAQEHFLPPDNFQELPAAVIAHRTSPTNCGLYLLTCVAARDLGWIGLDDLVGRISRTLDTLERLPHFKGHLLNWYDTRSLAPLEPRYVSTVDSGNYVGHLLAVSAALDGFAAGALCRSTTRTGPLDSLRACFEALGTVRARSEADGVAIAELRETLLDLRSQLDLAQGPVTDEGAVQQSMINAGGRIEDLAAALAADTDAERHSVLDWAAALNRDLMAHYSDLQLDPRGTAMNLRPSQSAMPASAALELRTRLQQLASRCRLIVEQTEFGFLFDRTNGLLHIGYRIGDDAPDAGHYDLLASEARLASLVAIAKGDVPRSHWFKLGRRLTGGSRHAVLASWSGSMFEYLMPTLVLREPQGSLLHQTSLNAVHHQIEFGERHGLPWGVSESGYNVRDRDSTYQYSAFGLPALGLKRGLGAERVIAPYATALAAAFEPQRAAENYRALQARGARGTYGFYEAIDFSSQRVPAGQDAVIVRSFMAHHQAMTIVAIANTVTDCAMQVRLHSVPMIRAAELLLQERAVRFADAPELIDAQVSASRTELPDEARQVNGAFSPMPVTHLLSNRYYSVMVTDSGAGYSLCRDLAVTRWREDATRDAAGSFIYLRDIGSGKHWSAGFQPTAVAPDQYTVSFREERVVIARVDGDIHSTLEIVVATEDNGELRRVTLFNAGALDRDIELTSFAEVVLAPHRADLAHPAFSNLFIQTEFDSLSGALLAHRRRRSPNEPTIWATHVVSMATASHVEYETDRARFIGRTRNARSAASITTGRPLSNTVGAVLDPVFSLRTRVTVAAGSTVSVTFSTLVAESRAQAVALAMKYRHPSVFENVAELAWTFARAELHHLQSDLQEARLFQALGGNLLFGSRELRAGSDVIAANRLDTSRLWRYSISGDRPILLIRCHSVEEMGFLQQCLRAQEYLRVKRLFVDIVILNELEHSYTQDLQDSIDRIVRARASTASGGDGEERGATHSLRADQISVAERELLLALARVVLAASHGSLAEQLRRPNSMPAPTPTPRPARHVDGFSPEAQPKAATTREFFNGLGGFATDGREYAITLDTHRTSPMPWCNVIANPLLGTLVTENGAMCTWSLNSRENQITPWSNDAVSDPSGEALYIVDMDSRATWSPTAQPIRLAEASYEVRHGQGYSRFLTRAQGVATELLVFVAADDPVKYSVLTVTNGSPRRRRLTIAVYVEWLLGAGRGSNASTVVTDIDPETGAMLARNAAQIDFGTRVSFCDLGGRQQHWTGSRREFLGRNGDLAAPAGLQGISDWSRRVGGGFDPCCAFAVTIEIEPQGTDQIVLLIGQADTEAGARAAVLRARAQDPQAVLRAATRRWDDMLGAVQIRTPDRALDILFNRWLLYQTVASRIWARAGFYQAGGAYGFRDQLQDGMALGFAAPELSREHILRAAARQFRAGDVQHWWHPPSGRGVRTHSSDDRLWLPFVVDQYVGISADRDVLDAQVPFIEGDDVPAGREDAHYVPTPSTESATLYEHCALALDSSLRVGIHHLPLMGGGDWNDGMNRVGSDGRGESLWLAWFLIDILRKFAPLAEQRGEQARAATWRAHAQALATACETAGWDGAWYRRAFFDDGTPLGSADNSECRIDSLAQSWAVLSGAADATRAERAMNSVDEYLVQGGDGLVLLFTPPFDRALPDPGYIKGYLPGLRENGGQYTHAAIWVLMAHARLGHRSQVGALLDMLNPIRRAESRSGMQAYRVEPYVIAADIYSCAPNNRRGGWTWYTGAAGWFHQAILEYVLGVRIRGDVLTVTPCMPLHWGRFEVALKRPGIDYLICVDRDTGAGKGGTELDGVECPGGRVPLRADGLPHVVRVSLD